MTDFVLSQAEAKCFDCGRLYGGEHGFPDLVIPNDIWAEISPTKNKGGLLCPSCICKRLYDAGIKNCPSKFTSGPLCTEALKESAGGEEKCVHEVGMPNLPRCTKCGEYVLCNSPQETEPLESPPEEWREEFRKTFGHAYTGETEYIEKFIEKLLLEQESRHKKEIKLKDKFLNKYANVIADVYDGVPVEEAEKAQGLI